MKGEKIKSKIVEIHGADERQLEIIFSEENRLMVEAPAGYGKTKTLVSKLAYMLATQKIAFPKKALVLTFSVNAALKAKIEISEQLPKMLETKRNSRTVDEKLKITNYHGFARSVLSKYGTLINSKLIEINDFKVISARDYKKYPDIKRAILYEESKLLVGFEDSINKEFNVLNLEPYNNLILSKFVSNNYITHSALITLMLEIFKKHPGIMKMYQNLYPCLIIDEYQDTNILGKLVVESLISDTTNLLFLGDSLQRVYGFIGALPDIIEKSISNYSMKEIKMNKNYRFKDNPQMLCLDRNIRSYSETLNGNNGNIVESAKVPFKCLDTQEHEGEWVAQKVKYFLEKYPEESIAILNKQRGNNSDVIEESLRKAGITYFYGMFTDSEEEYIEFHQVCLFVTNNVFRNEKKITKKLLNKFYKGVGDGYKSKRSKTIISLLKLLSIFIVRFEKETKGFPFDDKMNYLIDIFENRQLKQNMQYVECNVFLSTVHAAKGLEWDRVVLVDVEKEMYPFYQVCNECKKYNCYDEKCIKQWQYAENKSAYFEELSVLYVGVTRARKQVFLTASSLKKNNDWVAEQSGDINGKSYVSCMLSMPGIELVEDNEI